ncbi:MFS transporter [Daejeonella oryzae]|uniref:MFS transporter n=1 Tax=Daejeonella oryzae TaxID=1122943 RepID=UPI00041DAC8F|nr:MFS transporter [Daejeonella oryzae]
MEIKLGLKENWKQFTILVIINGFVGGMIGLERTILPQLAEQEFAMLAKSAILSFIVVFGFTKAITNYFAGTLANKVGRKNLLIYGWIIALPVPFLLMFGPTWNWIILANILLGINQGLTWSSTVVMKIDLVGEKDRGFAMGLNEFAGYLAVALVALLSGYIAGTCGLRPYPFMIGIGLSVLGLLATIFLVNDTRKFVSSESNISHINPLKNIFLDTSFRHPNLSSISQAGLINNLNDGMIWGLFPVLLASKGYSLAEIGITVAIYPAVWGIGQLFTGKLADLICKKKLLFWGMLLQGIAIILLVYASSQIHYALISVILGLGTAVVYPAFLAAIADDTHPDQRAESIGIFRLWRDSGYAFGAIISGILADSLGINFAIGSIGFLTVFSAIVIQIRMRCGIISFNCASKLKPMVAAQ